jgi:hypothetical protein
VTNNEGAEPAPWYRSSHKNMALFALIWLGEFFLILLLLKWMFHAGPKIFLFIIPWAVMGWVNAFRPNWIARLTQLLELKRPDKWNPPGFP